MDGTLWTLILRGVFYLFIFLLFVIVTRRQLSARRSALLLPSPPQPPRQLATARAPGSAPSRSRSGRSFYLFIYLFWGEGLLLAASSLFLQYFTADTVSCLSRRPPSLSSPSPASAPSLLAILAAATDRRLNKHQTIPSIYTSPYPTPPCPFPFPVLFLHFLLFFLLLVFLLLTTTIYSQTQKMKNKSEVDASGKDFVAERSYALDNRYSV